MTLAATSTHPTAIELLRAYLGNIQDPDKIASLFAEDGVIELPPIKMRAQGPDTIRAFLQGLLTKVPTFGFKNTKVWIETPDKVFAEYSVEALVTDTGKTYRQTYSGLLIAENGRIKLIREALDTAEAARAFSKD